MSRIWAAVPYGKKQNRKRSYLMSGKSLKDIFRYDLKNNIIGLGASSLRKSDGTFVNPVGLSREELEKVIKTNHPEYRTLRVKDRTRVIWQTYNEVKEGDFIIAKSGLRDVMAIGKVFSKNGKVTYFSVKQGVERTGNKYNPHPIFINVKWKEDYMNFGEDVFLRNRFGDLRKIVVGKYYPKYGRLIEQRIKELWGKDCIFDELNTSENEEKPKHISPAKPVIQKNKLEKVKNENLPAWLKKLQERVLLLREDRDHQERAHESLVEMFYEGLGYERFTDIQYRKGRIDVSIVQDGKIIIVTEVKKDWGLTVGNENVVSQAYNYAHNTGARFVVITNGDYYGIFDRDNGRTYKEQLLAEFNLSDLKLEDMRCLKVLYKE